MESDTHCSCCNFKRPTNVQCSRDDNDDNDDNSDDNDGNDEDEDNDNDDDDDDDYYYYVGREGKGYRTCKLLASFHYLGSCLNSFARDWTCTLF